jgi:hypothetical protein
VNPELLTWCAVVGVFLGRIRLDVEVAVAFLPRTRPRHHLAQSKAENGNLLIANVVFLSLSLSRHLFLIYF